MLQEPIPKIYRALFLSDVHLGAKACQAAALLDFLKATHAETIYLVGDIVDFWRIKRGPFWPQAQNDVVQKILRKVRKGSRVVYIPGNHDEALREFCGMHFGGIEIVPRAMHRAADGRLFLVTHGDEFDIVVRYARWLALLGDGAYGLALWLNGWFNRARRGVGLPYWSLSAYLKYRVKSAVNYIGEFETALAQEARRLGAEGVICGHIHHAAMRSIGDVLYINTGDWVESLTAIGETLDGRFEILRWSEMTRLLDGTRSRAEIALVAA